MRGWSFRVLIFEDEIEEGIDISPVEIKSARMRGKYRNLKIANVLDLPYEDGTFETIFSNCVLEHIQDIDNALIEISRVLKKDGTLIFTVPSDTYGENLFHKPSFQTNRDELDREVICTEAEFALQAS